MAALAYGFCYAIRELYAVTNAFFRCGCDIHKSLNYIRAKNRLRLFQKYCEAVWLQYEYESLVDYASDSNSNNIRCDSKNVHRLVRFRTKMHRRKIAGAEIDFAAMEATAMAREAAEGYLMRAEQDETDSDLDANKRLSLEHELEFETLENPEEIEIVSGVEADISYYDHIDSHPQCRENNLGVLKEGVCFIVTGRILLTCERFSINFLIENSTRDVALHINPRLPQNYIVRNTRVRNVWGHEEIATNLHFSLNRGTEFVIQVLLTEKCFMISTNGRHVADYKHRLPYRTIKAIEVKGDVEKVQIKREIVSKYPERQPHITREIRESLLSSKFKVLPDGTIAEQVFYQAMKSEVIRGTSSVSVITEINDKLPMPYVGKFDQSKLDEGRALSFEGRIKLLPHSFYINLQDGVNIWPHQNIAFHFNPRFSSYGGANLGKAVVCRNAWYNGEWAKEQRSELDTHLMPGKRFNLIILCTKDSFKVYVNGMLITTFKYQISPTTVNTVYVRGDVHLTDVSLLVPKLPRRMLESGDTTDDAKTGDKMALNVKNELDASKKPTMNITNNPSYDPNEKIPANNLSNDQNENIDPNKPNAGEFEIKSKDPSSEDSIFDETVKVEKYDDENDGSHAATQRTPIQNTMTNPSSSEFESALEYQTSADTTMLDENDKEKRSESGSRRASPK